jgi:HlyD family secretion protein
MKKDILLITSLLFIAGCRDKAPQADAFGNFEATEVTVSAETNGRILTFDANEGSEVKKGDVLAVIDTTLFGLQNAETDAAVKGIRTKLSAIDAQNAILNQQLENLDVNIRRTRNLLKDDAATQKQLDDLTGQASVIEKQVAANNIQKSSVAAELQVYASKKATLAEQINRCTVRSPLDGTILQKYSEAGEITAAGKPLARIADLSLMKLKVYVSGAQIAEIKTGRECTVRVDNGEKGYSTFKGRVTYISGKAEFTPKIIQTKEERVTLVYPVTIEVENDGTMKSGMPGEAIF